MTTWSEASARLGRNDFPYALVTNWHDLESEAERRKALEQAWVMPEWPSLHAPKDVWVSLFEQVLEPETYLRDHDLAFTAELPVRMTLWRGATEDRALGMSWTEDKYRARWFANRFEKQPLWEIEILPEYGEVLAHFTHRSESEWVLNLDGWETTQLRRIA